jgi:hypothetical protein
MGMDEEMLALWITLGNRLLRSAPDSLVEIVGMLEGIVESREVVTHTPCDGIVRITVNAPGPPTN